MVLAVGPACYALWKLVQGVMDADGKGSSPHGILRRVGFVGSAAIHGALSFTAAQSSLAPKTARRTPRPRAPWPTSRLSARS
jgi:hypothetical protein